MRVRIIPWLWLALGTVALPVPALAYVQRAGGNTAFTETIHDDLYIAGGTVTTNAAVDGDVAAAGGTVDINGHISGGVLAWGGTLKVGGAIGRSVRAAGGSVIVDSQIAGDAILAGGNVTVEPTAQIDRDLVVGGGEVSASGTVGRNATVYAYEVVLGGTIHGDAQVEASRIVLLPAARIGGRLRYSADQPIEVQPGAHVAGGVERLPPSAGANKTVTSPMSPRVRPWWALAEALVLLVTGLVVFWIAPRAAPPVIGELSGRFGRSLVTGFVLAVIVPVVAFLLVCTVIGIPLSATMMLLYLATLYPAQIFVAAWLGGQILRRLGAGGSPSIYWSLVPGTIVLVLLFEIPFLGWIIRLVAVCAGFGALWHTVWKAVAAPRPVSANGAPTPA